MRLIGIEKEKPAGVRNENAQMELTIHRHVSTPLIIENGNF